VFIFATTELHKVPATIKSRCQQFAFRLIPIERIAEILADTCKEMNIQAEEEALFWIAKESTGSLRDAYTLFDQVASFSDGQIRSELIREKLGLVGLDKLNALADACAENNIKEAFAIVDDLLNSGVAIEQFVIDLSGYYRSLLLLKNGVTRDSLLGYSPERFSSLVIERTNSIQIERALSLLLDLYRDIRYSVSPRFELETTVSKLAWINQWVSSTELKTALDDVRQFVPQGISANTQKKNDSEQNGEINRPLAGAGENQARPIQTNIDTESVSFLSDEEPLDTSDALTEGFKRLMSAKEGMPSVANNKTNAAAPKEQANDSVPDTQSINEEEVPTPLPEPVWDNYRNEGNTVSKPKIDEDDDNADAENTSNIDDNNNVDIANTHNIDTDNHIDDEPIQHSPLSLSEAKEKLIATFKKERALFASGLEKSLNWEWNGDKLIIPVQDFLVAELLQKDINLVKEDFVSVLQKPVIIEITVRNGGKNNADTSDEKTISPQVEMVRQFFRGTIVKAK
jgi:DNA polymerase-3 subunit gamma/tau